jgi:hypothetical protein
MNKRRVSDVPKFRFHLESRSAVFFITFLMMGATFTSLSSPQSIHQQSPSSSKISDGQILFAPMWGTTTYLINYDGTLNHTWTSSFYPGTMVRWLGNGTILRTIQVGWNPGFGGAGGGVQKVEMDGTVVWDFRYNTNGVLSHHDVKSLPNGNVLLIAWETKTYAEAIATGRNPSYVSSGGLMPDHIIEVEPTGPTSGTIVWEWHVWDHLIQDYDSSKSNYGVVGNHPELVDINFGSDMQKADWMHTNSIDYNEEFDQILLSVHNFNEIWVIDHSTTKEEAANHTGGNSGKGGDLLYRWGNPLAYRAGTAIDQKFFGQHDATWIEMSNPGGGNILVFNNGMNRPGDSYSSVDEILPPVNLNGEYYLAPGSAYGPATTAWSYKASPPSSFYSSSICGATRLKNGNTLICSGNAGKFFEVTPTALIVWQYTNPYPTPGINTVFKIVYIPPEELEPPEPIVPDLDCSGSLSWSDIDPGETVGGSFQIKNIGDANSLLNWTIDTSSITWGTWSYSPESGENLTPDEGQVAVHVTVIAPDKGDSDFEGYIRVENKQNSSDFSLIPVSLTTPTGTHDIQEILHQGFLRLIQRFTFIGDFLFLRTFFKNHRPLIQ